MKQNVSCISSKYMCCACGACISVCPKKVITLQKTSLGRLFVNVSHDCIDCGLCLKVCPSYTIKDDSAEYYSLDKKNIVVGKALDYDILRNAQSGGAVTAILTWLFNENKIDAALVCQTTTGFPVVITNALELNKCQGSCYTPVSLLTELDKITSYKSVAIVGLPCHILGVTNIMKYKRMSIKYKLGLICDRNLCGTIQTGILKYFGIKNKENVLIKWRDKTVTGFNYKNAPISIFYRKDYLGFIPSRVRQKLKSIFIAPRCLCCPDKLNLSADIVFGDPWGIGELSDKGESLIIVNNDIGTELLIQAVASNVIEITHNCSKEELNVSQHILARREQVTLYRSLFSPNGMLKYIQKNGFSCEFLRGLYLIVRFYILELLPQSWIENYVVRLIRKGK